MSSVSVNPGSIEGLQPRAVTRDLDWGVPVPLPDAKGKVLYVWFDAPIGYISPPKLCSRERIIREDGSLIGKIKDTRLIHFIGKDNIVFHCIIFPAMLKAHGEFILPENVPANEFLNLEGDKISTSRNWAVWLNEYLEEFPGKQDVLRYALTATAPETRTMISPGKIFRWEIIMNSLQYLEISQLHLCVDTKNYAGKVPAAHELKTMIRHVFMQWKIFPEDQGKTFCNIVFVMLCLNLMNLARIGNKFGRQRTLEDSVDKSWACRKQFYTYPWKFGIPVQLMSPFLPFHRGKIVFNVESETKTLERIFGKQLLKGWSIGRKQVCFWKIEDDVIALQLQTGEIKGSKSTKRLQKLLLLHRLRRRPQVWWIPENGYPCWTILTAERVPRLINY